MVYARERNTRKNVFIDDEKQMEFLVENCEKISIIDDLMLLLKNYRKSIIAETRVFCLVKNIFDKKDREMDHQVAIFGDFQIDYKTMYNTIIVSKEKGTRYFTEIATFIDEWKNKEEKKA